MGEQDFSKGNMIRLADRMMASDSFNLLYREGMGLVEDAAGYLDGEGRADAKRLSRVGATLYAAESMRLTTRLMQVASWLLLQRALRSGEMSKTQVAVEKAKVFLDTRSASEKVPGWSELPSAFCDLVHHSVRLQDRVRRMDHDPSDMDERHGSARRAVNANPVSDQLTLLQTAFTHR
ncbi:MAG: DUF1465 family protein [Phyllobacterium sp.]